MDHATTRIGQIPLCSPAEIERQERDEINRAEIAAMTEDIDGWELRRFQTPEQALAEFYAVKAVCAIPDRYRAGFDGLISNPNLAHLATAIQTCINWCASAEADKNARRHICAGNGLYICGQTGNGKTGLAAACALRLIESGMSVQFWNAGSLISTLRDAYKSDDGPTEHDLVSQAVAVDVLVLDDWGAELVGKDTLSLFYGIVNGRYEQMRPIIVTSNLSGSQLGVDMAKSAKGMEQMHVYQVKRIMSRLCECASNAVVIEGHDARKETAREINGRAAQ